MMSKKRSSSPREVNGRFVRIAIVWPCRLYRQSQALIVANEQPLHLPRQTNFLNKKGALQCGSI